MVWAVLGMVGTQATCAHASSSCERRLFQSFTRITRDAVATRKITPQHIDAMVASPVALDPLRSVTPVSANLSLKKYYEFAAQSLSPTEWNNLKPELAQILREITQAGDAATIAHQATAAILAPVLIADLPGEDLRSTSGNTFTGNWNNSVWVEIDLQNKETVGAKYHPTSMELGESGKVTLSFPGALKPERRFITLRSKYERIEALRLFRNHEGRIFVGVASFRPDGASFDGRAVEIFEPQVSGSPIFTADYGPETPEIQVDFFERNQDMYFFVHGDAKFAQFFEPLKTDASILNIPITSPTAILRQDESGQIYLVLKRTKDEFQAYRLFNI